jgi:hypothetical protein
MLDEQYTPSGNVFNKSRREIPTCAFEVINSVLFDNARGGQVLAGLGQPLRFRARCPPESTGRSKLSPFSNILSARSMEDPEEERIRRESDL